MYGRAACIRLKCKSAINKAIGILNSAHPILDGNTAHDYVLSGWLIWWSVPVTSASPYIYSFQIIVSYSQKQATLLSTITFFHPPKKKTKWSCASGCIHYVHTSPTLPGLSLFSVSRCSSCSCCPVSSTGCSVCDSCVCWLSVSLGTGVAPCSQSKVATLIIRSYGWTMDAHTHMHAHSTRPVVWIST